jgi:xylulokinase
VGACLGDAMLAAGVDVSVWNPPDHVVHPSGDDRYDVFYARYRELYPGHGRRGDGLGGHAE